MVSSKYSQSKTNYILNNVSYSFSFEPYRKRAITENINRVATR